MTLNHHPSTLPPPHGALWRRGGRRDVGDVPRSHAELVVLLGTEGRGRYLLADAEVTIEAGTLVWAPSGAAHMLLEAGAGFDMWVVVAHPKLWERPATAPMTTGAGKRQLGLAGRRELSELARVLVDLAAEARGTGLRWWLTRARQLWDAADETGATRWHPAVARAAHLLEDDPSLALPELARRVGLGASQLGRVFARDTGQSITSFRNTRRLAAVDRACSAGKPLLPSVLDAGFGSYSQFYRVFQTSRGQSPRDWYRARS